MRLQWILNEEEMRNKLEEARASGHTRLYALAYDGDQSPVQWRSAQDETEMQRVLNSRDESESILFNCAIAVAVINPADTDETIASLLAGKQRRHGEGPGYFSEAYG